MKIDWIAEIGSCHKGKAPLAYRMIKEIAQAGATTIKFQAGRDPNDPVRYADKWLPLAKLWCEDWDTEFLASCWSLEGLDLCRRLGMKRRKIAHQQLNLNSKIFNETLNETLTGQCEVIISADETAMNHRLMRLFLQWNERIRWLYVCANYPTYPDQFHKPDMGDYDGFSNHTFGTAAPLWAVSHGARIVECHVTLDPTEESVKDNHFALTPDEFHEMVLVGNQIAMLGESNDDN